MKEAIQLLGDAGHVAYVVGGSVRDFLLGLESKDHDIATSASPDELVELFPRSVTVGKAFGVIKVPVNVEDRDAPVLMEIASFREDLDYRDHRHPSRVRFAGPEEDAQRRDFTINALFYDAKTARILDSTGGFQDLRDRVIRAIGDPDERFREDALRLLRAVRFASRLGFAIEPSTAAAILARSRLISKVSSERIRDELTMMWKGAQPDRALQLLVDFGLLEAVLPELATLRAAQPSAWLLTGRLMQALSRQHPHRDAVLSWAALLLKAAQLSQSAPAPTARGIAERLRMSGEEIDALVQCIEEQPKFREVFKMREATLQRFVRQPGFERMLALHRIDALVLDGNLAHYEFCRSRFEEARSTISGPTRLLAGSDLIQLGLEPGPGFSEILRVVEDLGLERKIRTKEEALEYVVRNFVK